MGFNDRDIVALSGAHTVGHCHADRSGFEGAWTSKPLVFDNEFFKLLQAEWEPSQASTGNKQFKDKATGALMMLPSDLALVDDESFKAVVNEYAENQDVFFKDFAAAFQKLQELGYEF